MTKKQINDWLEERFPDEALLLADGFEDAFIGVATGVRLPVACYDRQRCIDTLMTRDGMSWEEAEEFFSFNVSGAWVGERTPVFLVCHRSKDGTQRYER
jgi:hypothetical protein